MDMGKQVCLALIVNSDLQPQAEEPQPFLEGEKSQILQGIFRKNILEELKSNQELLVDNEDDTSSGSDSDPSEDNLNPEETSAVYPQPLTPKPKLEEKKSNISAKKRTDSNRSLTSQKERNKTVQKCKMCGELELMGHVCVKPKAKLRPIVKSQPGYSPPMQAYYNAAGKKVRDQATQTLQVGQPIVVKAGEEVKVEGGDSRNNSISPVKVEAESRGSFRANSSDEASSVAKVWKNEKAFPNLGRSSRQSPAWKHADAMKK